MSRPVLTPEQKIAKRKKSQYLNFVKNTIRRASYRWPPRGEAEKAARVARGLYKCAHCENTFKRSEVELDHIEPVVPIKESWIMENGDPDWNLYIKRCFPDVDGYQMLCKTCHSAKTTNEDTMRAFYNAQRKEDDEK